jgi:hypothetical protein
MSFGINFGSNSAETQTSSRAHVWLREGEEGEVVNA